MHYSRSYDDDNFRRAMKVNHAIETDGGFNKPDLVGHCVRPSDKMIGKDACPSRLPALLLSGAQGAPVNCAQADLCDAFIVGHYKTKKQNKTKKAFLLVI